MKTFSFNPFRKLLRADSPNLIKVSRQKVITAKITT